MSGHAALFDRARRVTPGGVHSPVRAFKGVGGPPVFIARANGPYLVDVDGQRYIDFCMSFGPLILGHADPDVTRVVHAAVDDGWSFGACEPYSLELAEWIASRLPWIERIRFVSSGTEAVMSALRIARAATDRSKIVKFDGCYHGHADSMLVKAGSGLAGPTAASSAGIPDGILSDTVVLPLDDDSALAKLFDTAGPSIAAVIVEPLPANYGLLPQRDAWLRDVAARAKKAGALLILDEVISGFRIGRGGMTAALDLKPDLVCYGKVIGGGFPVGAYAGRADLMDRVAPVGDVYQAGTLSANPVGMRAGLATLMKMERLDGWHRLDVVAATFVDELRTRFRTVPNAPTIVHHGSLFWLLQNSGEPVRSPERIDPNHAAWYAKFFHAALKRGVYLPPAAYEVGFLSLAHDAAALAHAVSALAEAATEIAQ